VAVVINEDIDDQLEFSSDKPDYTKEFEKAVTDAEEKGFTAVRTRPNWVMLDLDDDDSQTTYRKQLPIARKVYGAKEYKQWRSKSGGLHVILKVERDLSVVERIALQACLGSDRKRELLGLKLVSEGVPEPIVLFRPGK
jgi:hypothetical protein